MPEKLQVKCCQEVEQLSEAIRSLRIGGAPALGVAGATGVVLSVARHRRRDRRAFEARLAEAGGVLTHCHTGALATCGAETAVAVLYEAHRRGRRFRVYADETRPLLQGARLTAWQLMRAGFDVTLICESAAGSLMAAG